VVVGFAATARWCLNVFAQGRPALI
jgi:hypothetical protein